MKKLILLACLVLGACQDASDFRNGRITDARVQLDEHDKCLVWVSVYNPHVGSDVGIHARIQGEGCAK